MESTSVQPADNDAIAPKESTGFRFSLWQLLVAITILAVILAVWSSCTRKVVTVRAPTADDPIPQLILFTGPGLRQPRNIVIIEGNFIPGMNFRRTDFAVEKGNARIQSRSWRGGNFQSSTMYWPKAITITLTMAAFTKPVGDDNYPPWQTVHLQEIGTCGGGAGGVLTVGYPPPFSQNIERTIVPGREYLIYVEGDQAPILTPEMTLDEFVQTNPGNYLVMTAELVEDSDLP